MIVEEKRASAALEALTRRVALRNAECTSGGGGVQAYNVLLKASRLDGLDYDVTNSWVTRQRWSMLTKQYLNGPAVDNWLDLIEGKLAGKRKAHGVAFLRSQVVKSRVTSGKPARQWGSCMIGWSFRKSPTPTLVMHSRSTYLGFLAPLDLGVAASLAHLAGGAANVDPADMGFAWHLDQVTFHTFRSMPWWYLDGKHQRYLKEASSEAGESATRLLGRFKKMDKAKTPYGDMAYAQERRFRMKWHEVTGQDPTPFLGVGTKAEVLKPLPKAASARLGELPLTMTELEDMEAESGYLG